MVDGLIGIKVGMTQVFDENGVVVPVTVIKAGPCVVVQKKTKDLDGYEAVQLGLVEFIRPSRVNKPRTGHFKKAGVPPCRVLREFRSVESETLLNVGDQILVNQVFQPMDKVDVVGTSKGKGFAGLVKRHHLPVERRATVRCFTALRDRSALRPIRAALCLACEPRDTWEVKQSLFRTSTWFAYRSRKTFSW